MKYAVVRRGAGIVIKAIIEVPGAPQIKGLSFRGFEEESDYSLISSVGGRSFQADGVDYFETAEDLMHDYQSSPGRDPHAEIVIGEVNGVPIAYSRTWSDPGPEGKTMYWHIANVVPEWRRAGLRLSMLRFNEQRIITAAKLAGQGDSLTCCTWALDEHNDWRDLIVAQGYRPVMHFFEMIRPTLEDIPEAPFPAGLEIRPAKRSEYPMIWNASREAFRGKPWFIEANYDKEHYESWASSPLSTPELWRVAWDGDEVAGMARNEIPVDQNREFRRSRGHTLHLSVMPKWRRKGLGRALLAESLRVMRDLGLKEASLDVETQSTTGEVDLYLSMGYQINRKYAHYAKDIGESKKRGTSIPLR